MVKAVPKLTLKRELAMLPPEKPRGPFTVASIWVDTSIYHLDGEFSYLIPGNLASDLYIGSFVSVPFHGRELVGLVIAMSNSENFSGLKSISRIIGSIPLVSQEIIELIEAASARYAAHPFDLIRSAVPDRIASVEKGVLFAEADQENLGRETKLEYLQFPPSQSRFRLLAQKVSSLHRDGSVLVVLPDSGEVQGLFRELTAIGHVPSLLDSSLPKGDIFRNFITIRIGEASLVIGTRSAIFAPARNLRSIIIVNEGSENHYERRTPGWNTREIALLRSRNEEVDLYFAGYSPSSEVVRLIDIGECQLKRSKAKVNVHAYQQSHGELLPSRAVTLIRRALQEGPILLLTPMKGYAQAIRCNRCKTISRCTCGGAHVKSSHSAPIMCDHCSTPVVQWKCSWCENLIPTLQARGIERHSHELGALFPGITIHQATAGNAVDRIDHGLLICTPGMAPVIPGGYAAIVVLEGNRFLDQPDMRASERVREMYFSTAALARDSAPIILIQDETNPITTALTTWNPLSTSARELEERKSLSLPPYVRIAHLTMDSSEITRLKRALTAALNEGRLPSTTKILGPIPSGDKFSLIISVSVDEGDELIRTIHEFMKRRSAAKKSLPSLRIDPYSLSR